MLVPIVEIDELRTGSKHPVIEMSCGRPTDARAEQVSMFEDAPLVLLSCDVAADPLTVYCPTCRRSFRKAKAGQRVCCTGLAFQIIR